MGKKIRMILLLVLCAVFIFSAGNVVKILYDDKKNDELYAQLRREYIPKKTSPQTGITGTEESEEDVPQEEAPVVLTVPEVDIAGLREENDAVMGWIWIGGTKIDYPVVQAEDNQYYVTHAFDGSSNANGSIFLDYRNSSDFSDYNSVIYGHNIKNGYMFGSLRQYLNEEFYKEHPSFYLITEKGTYRYEVFSSYITLATSDSYRRDFENREEWFSFLSELEARSGYHTSVSLNDEDKIITLSTCTNGREEDRIVVHGRLVIKD